MIQVAPQQTRDAPSATVVAKFGGTSVASFDAMSRSADVVLSNPDVRLVI
ncbi:lysine-sensitive aspartokinase 3, partial [Yersinia pestis subsp. pestis]|nr:lysine-sensitive aspartokinase 3 [Yersinia pestis subsp. pestis]